MGLDCGVIQMNNKLVLLVLPIIFLIIGIYNVATNKGWNAIGGAIFIVMSFIALILTAIFYVAEIKIFQWEDVPAWAYFLFSLVLMFLSFIVLLVIVQ